MGQPDISQACNHQQGLHSYETIACSYIGFEFFTLFLSYKGSIALRSSSDFARVAADFSDLDIDIRSQGIPEILSSLSHYFLATG